MASDTLTTKQLQSMFIEGYNVIFNRYEYINNLNVFPVPDGDTGTNMKITTKGGVDAISDLEFNSLQSLGKVFATGLFMNACGNSGVIFSQIIKGFTKSLPDGDEVGIKQLINSFKEAKEVAYSVIQSPVEGTILTVVRLTADQLVQKQDEISSVEQLFELATEFAKDALKQTPKMLPALKSANVVDSGGFGLVSFLEGMLTELTKDFSRLNNDKQFVNKKALSSKAEQELVEEGHGYCTEFLLKLGLKAKDDQTKIKFNEEKFKKEISKDVESLVLINDKEEGIVKLHAHTLTPDLVLKHAQPYGEFLKIKIENMNKQVTERKQDDSNLGQLANKPIDLLMDIDLSKIKDFKTETAIIATVPSRVLGKMIVQNYDVDQFIDTSATGNPTIKDFVKNIYSVKSKNVIIVVDDTNLLLSAKEAIALLKKHINCELISCQNFIEALSAISGYMRSDSLKSNVKVLHKIIKSTGSAFISTSVKNIKYPHLQVHKGDYIGVMKKKIIVSDSDIYKCLLDTVAQLIDEVKKPELVLIIYGKNTSSSEVRTIVKLISEKFGIYCEAINGSQKLYQYYIGVQ
ncbi:DAK2 domain-containing protein [Mycoplasmoides gallisepticum]|uniref:DAK2 domain-containing protein n=1 Tax=Mycoplasmoides gallisepticum TaxID=2096 RepID=UPI001246BCE0|nr:DAK2 domain-containing protein [Mycoplasmoides gallisepticum]QEX47421.1 DAK2 domain-containing protein [Mycoplasmoides gallisepticum]ULH62031.1 DAK2 domain-containing protein [Mycoplasmoides gallisepticum]ULH67373.1 DAK2 domain-containing protein [Mycoplasmoides gallisepticum]ULH68099.1 DAK2 domain-containing protein [Mycoplasmoides gallisepticum]WGG23697.1 DAK2 domain-containing protein [Mycoplasmoides gallisepticum]